MAYLALYRKYRPRTFDEVVGQDDVTQILKHQIMSGRIGHAYLFTGIRGTGKTSIAKIFARAINCENNTDGNPCNACTVCREIEKPGVMDVIEIDGASNRGVDEIRDIREKVKYPPTLGRYKVYIIDEVHMLTKEAFNALLKTLEEPPDHVVFILATTEPNKLPMTILSRCQRYDIRPISQEAIAGRIAEILDDIGVTMEDEARQFVASRGDHSMRDALSLLDQIIDIGENGKPITYEQVVDFLGMADKAVVTKLTQAIINRQSDQVLLTVKALRQKGKDSALIMGQLIDSLRSLAVAKTARNAAGEILGITGAALDEIKTMADKVDSHRLFTLIDTLIEDKQKLKYNDMAGVILEMSLLKLCTGYEPAGNQGGSSQPVATAGHKASVEQAVTAAAPAPKETQAVQPRQTARRVRTPKEQHQDQGGQSAKPAATGKQPDQKAPAPAPQKETGSAPARQSGAVNTDALYKEMHKRLATDSPFALHMFEQGRLRQKDSNHLVLEFTGKDAAAPAQMLGGYRQFLENAARETDGRKWVLEMSCVKKNFEDMTFREKTEAIVNDPGVKIIERD